MASYEDSNWGFFVEIDNDSEHFRKYSSHYYNEWRKYNLETIEEGEYEDYDYALLCKQDFKIEKPLNKLIELWPLIKTKQAKIVLFEQTTNGSLKSIHSQLSYKITEKENIDNEYVEKYIKETYDKYREKTNNYIKKLFENTENPNKDSLNEYCKSN